MVLCTDGRLKPIEEICQWGHYEVLSLGADLMACPVASFYSDGVRACLRVRTRLGREVVLTPDHPLLTAMGWQKAKNLMIGEPIGVAGHLPYFGTYSPPDYKVILLAYLIGEGSLGQNYPIFTSSNEFSTKEFIEAVEKFGCRVKRLRAATKPARAPSYGVYSADGHQSKANYVREWLADLGLWGRISRTKFIPDEVFSYTKNKLALFLSRLLMCDGWVYLKTIQKGYFPLDVQIGYSSASSKLIHQISHLFLRFGIIGGIYFKKVKEWNYYSWQVNRNDEAKKLLDSIPLIGRFCETVEVAKTKLAKKRYHYYPVIWDKVVEITETLAQPVYDLTVPQTGNFIANDVVVHNTHLALATAWEWFEDGLNVIFARMDDLLDDLRRGYDNSSYHKKLERLHWCSLLVLDDLGAEHTTGWASEKIDRIVDWRYVSRMPLVVTTNARGEDLAPRVASRLADRNCSVVVQIDAEDYRISRARWSPSAWAADTGSTGLPGDLSAL